MGHHWHQRQRRVFFAVPAVSAELASMCERYWGVEVLGWRTALTVVTLSRPSRSIGYRLWSLITVYVHISFCTFHSGCSIQILSTDLLRVRVVDQVF
ncbi:hypothetical protein GALMADRAFT_631264 [Galerina marginata CBS 339.88]|uniref:Uncharacterized protein n=1 Tax=Galerina marginata (strain CBS 339.88) TaxID=685588 RepID=A0A067T3Z0_GALM3|nr:hypothetical protein GALMADRAFT_631264 [Galerina marginata CBS 339.88]